MRAMVRHRDQVITFETQAREFFGPYFRKRPVAFLWTEFRDAPHVGPPPGGTLSYVELTQHIEELQSNLPPLAALVLEESVVRATRAMGSLFRRWPDHMPFARELFLALLLQGIRILQVEHGWVVVQTPAYAAVDSARAAWVRSWIFGDSAFDKPIMSGMLRG
jgi:hypothetical protein